MNALTSKNKQGFTIIEVVLVLAIAALIFLMVFIALPALQRNQRDTQRRSDVGRVVSQIEQYKTNNKGAVPAMNGTSADAGQDRYLPTTFVTQYLNSEWQDPSGSNYTPVSGAISGGVANTSDLTAGGRYMYVTGVKCNGENTVAGSPRNYAIIMKLEGSGTFCQGN
jgi:prepilin-type N-terminal cleavage/methylation domain-containing protein